MREFKGTKGEWKVCHDINVESVSLRPICACGTFAPKELKSQEINKANAKLIAAAPDLLKSLQEMLPHFRKLTITEIEIAKKAEKAIKKALS